MNKFYNFLDCITIQGEYNNDVFYNFSYIINNTYAEDMYYYILQHYFIKNNLTFDTNK